jgi:hypothetical protein
MIVVARIANGQFLPQVAELRRRRCRRYKSERSRLEAKLEPT